jgi:hypothetical protein
VAAGCAERPTEKAVGARSALLGESYTASTAEGEPDGGGLVIARTSTVYGVPGAEGVDPANYGMCGFVRITGALDDFARAQIVANNGYYDLEVQRWFYANDFEAEIRCIFLNQFTGLDPDHAYLTNYEIVDPDETGGMDHDNSPSFDTIDSTEAKDSAVLWAGFEGPLGRASELTTFAEVGAFQYDSTACERMGGPNDCSFLMYRERVMARGYVILASLGGAPDFSSWAWSTNVSEFEFARRSDIEEVPLWFDGEFLEVNTDDHWCVLAGATVDHAPMDFDRPISMNLELYEDSNSSFLDYRVRIEPSATADASAVWVTCFVTDP